MSLVDETDVSRKVRYVAAKLGYDEMNRRIQKLIAQGLASSIFQGVEVIYGELTREEE